MEESCVTPAEATVEGPVLSPPMHESRQLTKNTSTNSLTVEK